MIYIDNDEVKISGSLIKLAAEANVLCEKIKEVMVRNGMSEEEAEREIVAVVKLSFVPMELFSEAVYHAPIKSNLVYTNMLDYIEYLKTQEQMKGV